MAGPEVVFLHIPKTAGTSQRAAFNRNFGTEHVFWIGYDCPAGIWRYPQSLAAGRPVVGGHKRLRFFPKSLDPLYCAMLRDPLERAISLFVYYTRPELAVSEREQVIRARELQRLRAIGIDPDSMANSIRKCRPFRREISNYQCYYLSRGRSTFAAARKSLQAHDFLLGTVSHYDRFRHELANLVDWIDEAPVKVNNSRDDYASAYLRDEEQVSLIEELNQEDRKLVQWLETEQQGLWLSLRDERARRRRLRQLPLKPGQRRIRQHSWDDAPELWPPRGPEKLPWPLNEMMLAESCRVLYMPTPGVADAAVRRTILEISSATDKEAILQLGIEQVVAQYETGLMLDDKSRTEIDAIAASGDYFKFAILYEPVTRLIDVFQQRFVQLRHLLPQWPRLYELLASVQGRAVPDPVAGISFRQFVRAVVSDRYHHKLWLSQTSYLPWPDTYNMFYGADQLPLLEDDLSRITGKAVRIEGAASLSACVVRPSGARYADTPAGALPTDMARWRAQLVDAEIYEMIKGYYSMDFKLYNRIADNTLEVVGT